MRFEFELNWPRFRGNKPANAEGRSYGQNFISPFRAVSKSGTNVTENSSLSLSAVYACVNKISSTLASLPLNVFRETEAGKDIAQGHPSQLIVSGQPNEGQTSYSFMERLVSDALLWGRGFAMIERGQVTGRPVAIHNMSPVGMEPKMVDGALMYKDNATGNMHFPDDLIIVESFRGQSPIRTHMENLGLASAAMEYGARFFGSGGNVGGFLMTDKSLSDDQYKRLKNTWSAQYGGIGNAHETAILEHGLKFERSTIPPDEAQFIATRKFQVEEIARIFNVPPVLIQADSGTTYNNVEQQQIIFAQQTLIPWARRIEQEFDRKLLAERERTDHFTRFEMRSLLRGDLSARQEFYTAMLQHGVMTINEVRNAEDMNAVDGGDLHFVQVNQLPLNSAEAYGDKLSATDAN